MSITRQALSAALILCLGGCSNIERFDVRKDENGTPRVDSIVDEVRCELAEVARPTYQYASILVAADMLAAIQLNLDVTDDGSLAPTFTYTSGMFSFNAGARLEAAREQNFTEKLIYSIKDMQKEIILAEKTHRPYPFPCPNVRDTNLAGDLGLKKSIEMALLTNDLNLGSKLGSGTDGAFGGFVQFTITKNLNAVGPTYTLTHFRGPGSLAGVSEINIDKLTFAFAERTPVDPFAPPAMQAKATAKVNEQLNNILLGEISSQLAGLRTQVR